MAAVTLQDYALSPKELTAGFAKVLQDESPFMDSLPFENVGTLAVKVLREGPLTSMATSWRKIGAAPTSVKVPPPTMAEEQAYAITNYIEIDKALLRDSSQKLYNPLTYQSQMIARSIAREFNDAIINNTPATSADKPVGIWWRVQNDLPSTQRITADPAGNSAGLDISPDAGSLASTMQSLLDKLDQLIYAVDGHKADVLLMNQETKLRLWSILRQANVLNITKDRYGIEQADYKGAKFIDMGWKYDDTTRIIGNVETLTGAALTGGTGTSIYAVRYGPTYTTGWQEYAMEVTPPVLIDDQVTYRSAVDWVVGLAVSGPRSIARLYGVIAA